MKKFAAILLSLVLTLTVALADSIYVVSREDGSGTRTAFIELTGVEQKDADGNKVDMTTVEAATPARPKSRPRFRRTLLPSATSPSARWMRP